MEDMKEEEEEPLFLFCYNLKGRRLGVLLISPMENMENGGKK